MSEKSETKTAAIADVVAVTLPPGFRPVAYRIEIVAYDDGPRGPVDERGFPASVLLSGAFIPRGVVNPTLPLGDDEWRCCREATKTHRRLAPDAP